MHRREFLASSLSLSASAAIGSPMTLPQPVPSSTPAGAASPIRSFYELRQYHLVNGPQTALAEAFFTKALIPALNRLGLSPIGAFRLEVGPETPSVYLLIPGSSAETLVTADLHLTRDEQFLAAAQPFWAAPAIAPSFLRVESSLSIAFEGWPKLVLPKQGLTDKRIFQLRIYESPSPAAHVRKVEMFHNGEFDIFAKAGFGQVFYGDTLIGARLPNLAYLLVFNDQADLDACWTRFRNDPAWAKLSHDPRYSYEEIVSNITNLILTPLACSQV